MKTILLLPDRCIACGLCQIHAPEVFDYYDNGIVKFTDSAKEQLNIPKKDLTEAILASRECPTHAIVLKKI